MKRYQLIATKLDQLMDSGLTSHRRRHGDRQQNTHSHTPCTLRPVIFPDDLCLFFSLSDRASSGATRHKTFIIVLCCSIFFSFRYLRKNKANGVFSECPHFFFKEKVTKRTMLSRCCTLQILPFGLKRAALLFSFHFRQKKERSKKETLSQISGRGVGYSFLHKIIDRRPER